MLPIWVKGRDWMILSDPGQVAENKDGGLGSAQWLCFHRIVAIRRRTLTLTGDGHWSLKEEHALNERVG